jgi:hypothetical protein
LPALLRAKKVLVLGDSAAEPAPDSDPELDQTVNDLQRDRLARSFGAHLRGVPADVKNQQLASLRENFDVRQSILKFVRAAANYETELHKYFRSPPELISYVDKTFYSDSLQTLKARTQPLNEIIRFTHVKPEPEDIAGLHTNNAEVQHIIAELTTMRQADYTGTIGIVTPSYKQAVLLQKELDECVISDWFTERKLRVMTPETSHGVSRDYIFYSLISNASSDDLEYALPEYHDQLCIGFSRASEVVHFVLSKPVEEFQGPLGDMLAHFQARLSAGNVRSNSVNDVLMAAESTFPQYFQATAFYKKHKDQAELVSQFSLGDLMRELSPKAAYPSYKVDFLIAYGSHRIVVSFDEFKPQFTNQQSSKELQANYQTATDVYNQKLLEGYGYTFLRINKFNLGSKPSDVLDRLLTRAISKPSWPRDNGFLG